MTMNIAVHALIKESFKVYQQFGEVTTTVEFLDSIEDIETFHCTVTFYNLFDNLNRQEFDIDIKKYNIKNFVH